ncbi:unnamed protein product [Adineta steineri]|uniref:ATP-grasp domain-containing protein n=1 Tax=Adineta steineri TaxID=433720 RepID=A0A819K5Q6_9BILA|nr:unnamed protein product [Adineta steineri]CAF1211599.1 unnamed protein product [Adineta steineri]CAF3944149.1 unnamed protein product [Adineta steineri]
MKLKYINSRIITPLNTCNVMSVAPIREIDDELVLWRPFFNGLSQLVLDYLVTLKYKVEDDFPIPYVPQTPASDKLNHLLMLYFESFDYQYHHDEKTMGIANIILVPNKYKEEMAEITNIRLQNDRSIKNFLERDPIEYLLPLIRVAMASHPTWFVKLSAQSNKHDFNIKSVDTAEGVLDIITQSPTLLRNEWQRRKKSTYIILKPWNPLINTHNEFRLFIWESKVTAATQQHWYTQLDHSQEYIDSVINVISDYRHSPKLPVNCVIDAVILEDAKMIIIELNPWICSGSGLFEWEMDYKVLYGLEGDVELRLANMEVA